MRASLDGLEGKRSPEKRPRTPVALDNIEGERGPARLDGCYHRPHALSSTQRHQLLLADRGHDTAAIAAAIEVALRDNPNASLLEIELAFRDGRFNDVSGSHDREVRDRVWYAGNAGRARRGRNDARRKPGSVSGLIRSAQMKRPLEPYWLYDKVSA